MDAGISVSASDSTRLNAVSMRLRMCCSLRQSELYDGNEVNSGNDLKASRLKQPLPLSVLWHNSTFATSK